jgi:hypothetical protein
LDHRGHRGHLHRLRIGEARLMARYQPAIWKPVDRYKPGGSNHTPMPNPGRLCFHTAVSSGDSLFGLFNTPGNAVAHFYIRQDGKVEQYVDTDTRASANLDGNADTISVESWDGGAPGGVVPDWTPAQVEAAAKLAAWVHDTHNIPLDPCDAHPGSRGVTWHRKGIDGNFPAGLLSGRKTGDEHWSNATGKICPGDKKIHGMVDKIIPRAKAILIQGDDMQQSDDLTPVDDTQDDTVGDSLRTVLRLPEQIAAVKADVDQIDAELDTRFAAVNANVNGGQEATKRRFEAVDGRFDALDGRVTELIDAVKALR